MIRDTNILEESANKDFYLDLAGPLNVATAETAISEIESIFADGHLVLSLGIDAIENVNSEIIGFLYVLTSTFNKDAKKFTIRCTNKNILRLLGICDHQRYLEIDTIKITKNVHTVYLSSEARAN